MTGNSISEVSLLGEVTGPVKDLFGFGKTCRAPEEHNARNSGFIRRAGSENVAEAAEGLFKEIRAAFHYKRKQLEVVCDEGGASIKTPDFDVTLTLDQDSAVAANYSLATEVSGFRTPEIVHAPHFLNLFSSRCDRTVLAFDRPISLEDKIDEIEENDELARCLDYDVACSYLTLRLPRLVVEVTAQRMVCRLPGERNLGLLIAQTQEAISRLSGAAMARGEEGRSTRG